MRDTRGWSCPPVLGVPCEMPRQELLCLAALVSPPRVTATRRGMTGRVAGWTLPGFCLRLRAPLAQDWSWGVWSPHRGRAALGPLSRCRHQSRLDQKSPPETQSPPVRWCQPHPDERGGTTKQGGRFCFCRDWAEQPRGATGGSSNSAPAARPLAARAARVVAAILTRARHPSRGKHKTPRTRPGGLCCRGLPQASPC